MNTIKPPKCKTLPHIRKYKSKNFVEEVNDPYQWLTDKNNPEVIDYLNQENSYTDCVMEPTLSLQKKLFTEIKSRIVETDIDVACRKDNYLYYTRTEEGKEYEIFCRKLALEPNNPGPEEVLFDGNLMAQDHEFFSPGDLEVSPCHNLLAYTIDTSGDELYDLFIKNLITQEITQVKLDCTISYELVWSNDAKHILYLKMDESLRPFQVMAYSLLGTHHLLFTETDEKFRLSLEKTRSEKYLVINSNSQLSAEVYYFPAHDIINNIASLRSIKPRQQHVEYYIDHYYSLSGSNKIEYFYILINSLEKPNFELYRTPVCNKLANGCSCPTCQAIYILENWELIIPHNPNIKLDDFECFADFAVLTTIDTHRTGLPTISIINKYNFNAVKKIDVNKIFNLEVYDLFAGDNEMYDTDEYIFGIESLNIPVSIYSINPRITEPDLRLIKSSQVLCNYNKDDYVVKRLYIDIVDASNTTDRKLPISIIYNKHSYHKNGKSPLLLYGYGSYGISIEPYFSYSRLSLLNRGIAFAIAHIRGGGELGDTWHYDGRLNKKKNTFSDFMTAAEYLIQNKYTSKDQLIVQGGSAGGLLIGNVINQRPELFKAAILEVPFVDCLNTMLNPDLPLTINEYEEWGNPSDDQQVYKYIQSYAPYEMIIPQKYPNLLLNNSLNDTRVSYWEAAKFTAKLRATKTDDNLVLLKTLMNAGHGGASGRYQALHDTAFTQSFILKCLEIEN